MYIWREVRNGSEYRLGQAINTRLYSCKFSHDLEGYLKIKPADLGDKCIQFDLFG